MKFRGRIFLFEGDRETCHQRYLADFCRRFSDMKILHLMTAFNRVRRRVWQQQPDEFLEEAIIEAVGTMVKTHGEKKEGIGMNYKKQWGYHPLVVTLPASSRQRPANAKAAVVAEKVCRNKQLMSEAITEFEYRPGKSSRNYRVVVVKK